MPPEEYGEVMAAASRDLVYLPARQRYERAASATTVERIDSGKVGAGGGGARGGGTAER